MFAGASNAPGRITFDMKNLNDVIISEDLESTIVGTGNTWGDVYKVLDPMNLTVVGGRDTGVGVGGFTLGGELKLLNLILPTLTKGRGNIFSLSQTRLGSRQRPELRSEPPSPSQSSIPRTQLKRSQVVLANGTLTNINQASAPDLYWALRGGGNNFGLVTRFHLETFPQSLAWGSFMNVLPLLPSYLTSLLSTFPSTSSTSPSKSLSLFTRLTHSAAQTLLSLVCRLGYCTTPEPVLRAFTNYALAEPGDPNSQLLLSFFRNPHTGAYFFNYGPIYSKPEPYPQVFEEFSKLPAVYYSRRIRSLSSIAAEIDSLCPVGLRFAPSFPFPTSNKSLF